MRDLAELGAGVGVAGVGAESRFERAGGVGVEAALSLHDGEVVVGVGAVGRAREGLIGVGPALLLGQHQSQVHLGSGEVGANLDRAAQRAFGLGVLAFEELAIAEVVQHLHVVGRGGEGQLELGRSLIVTTELVVGDAQAVVGRGESRLGGESLFVLLGGLGELSLPLEQVAVGEVSRRADANVLLFRFDAQGALRHRIGHVLFRFAGRRRLTADKHAGKHRSQ